MGDKPTGLSDLEKKVRDFSKQFKKPKKRTHKRYYKKVIRKVRKDTERR